MSEPARPEVRARRLPLRATGLLALLGVMLLATLLVASTLVFRGAIRDELLALDPPQTRPVPLSQAGAEAGAERARHLEAALHYLDGGAVAIACLAWLGITCVGAVSMLFFSRLAVDIGSVSDRARAIVSGDRSSGSPLSRNDELSDLACAVDRLAVALARHERDLELERHHAMHREKLATVGAMAAGVVREIGNPIAAIDGYARSLQEAQRSDAPAPAAEWPEPGWILLETRRLLAITHDIAELAAPPATQWQLLSLNELVARSLTMLRYEPRLEGVALAARPDPRLPAVMAAADRLMLLLVNLIVNAADSTAAMPPHSARVDVITRHSANGVQLEVADNGCGMEPAVLARAFEPLFTTKQARQGTGLGLPLCRAIVLEHGGSIDLLSEPGRGTRVLVWLPVGDAQAVKLPR